MNRYSKFILALITVFQTSVFSQMIKLEVEGEVFNMPEVEAVIAKQDGKIEVVFTHAGMRMAEYKDIDLLTKDEIFMANGKKLTTVKELKEIYEKIEIGETLKMAVKRDGKNLMISVVKADPKDLPKRKIKMKKASPEDEEDDGKVIMKREVKKNE